MDMKSSKYDTVNMVTFTGSDTDNKIFSPIPKDYFVWLMIGGSAQYLEIFWFWSLDLGRLFPRFEYLLDFDELTYTIYIIFGEILIYLFALSHKNVYTC